MAPLPLLLLASLASLPASLGAVPGFGPPRGDALSGLWPLPTGPSSCSGPALSLGPTFVLSGPTELSEAFTRYHALLFPPAKGHTNLPGLAYDLAELVVNITSSDADADADESYELHVRGSAKPVILLAHSTVGALRGLERFTQLVVDEDDHGVDGDGVGAARRKIINSTRVDIVDSPRFAHRGLMLDSARHFEPVDIILQLIEGMSANFLNVLHWHITDDQSFPLLTKLFPKLGADGAYGPGLTYSEGDVTRVVNFAKARGIRVIPELDSPGHALSWAQGYPDLAVRDCHTLDPTNEKTFEMLDAVFGELAVLFPDEHVHLGCDEVSFSCWNQSAKVVERMAELRIPRTDAGFRKLTSNYISRLAKIVAKHGKTPIAWQEAMDHYGEGDAKPTPPAATLPPDLIIEQWLSPVWNWANASAITSASYAGRPNATWPAQLRGGFKMISTNGWYLDAVPSINDWTQAYAKEPLTNQTCTYDDVDDEAGGGDRSPAGNCSCQCPENPWRDGKCHCYDLRFDAHHAKMVLGGEAPLWGEHIDSTNLLPRAFPRASAVAERLWSSMTVNNATKALPRLVRQRCRMLSRGIPVTPLGPGYC